MLSPIILMIASLAGEVAAPPMQQLQGQCSYPEQMIEATVNTAFWPCNSALRETGASGTTWQFNLPSGVPVRMSGQEIGAALIVERITLPGGRPMQAAGRCRYYIEGAQITGIACSVEAAGQFHAVIFERF